MRAVRTMTSTQSLAAILWVVLASVAVAQEKLANGPHDLSVHGRGDVRATEEEGVCVFCHAPHHTDPATPLWNRFSPPRQYRVYESSTTDARIDQPTGPSKMCLSCHDGSLAIGLVRSRGVDDPINTTTDTMPPGPANLGNDLSDDHPIGLRYDRALSNMDGQLRDPSAISRQLTLGPHRELQCTTCHDAHDNSLGDFLRITDRGGALCTSCHQRRGWARSAHARAGAHVRGPLGETGQTLPYRTMSDNACLACHQIHGAPRRERLLRYRRFEDNCLVCHNGSVATDIASLMTRRSNHHDDRVTNIHDAAEPTVPLREHVACVDCHNPHAAQSGPRVRLARIGDVRVPPAMIGIPGVSVAGRTLEQARFAYEVCLRCHGDRPVRIDDRIVRQVDQPNVRRQIATTAASSHPFVTRGTGTEIPSLLPEYRSRRISCQDCHNAQDAAAIGGAGPNGPHGSTNPFLLANTYRTEDFAIENANAYALCYRCHDRSSILGDESFSLHRRHIVNSRTSCSVCHAPHGVTGSRSEHGHLVNFDLSIVQPASSATARGIQYRDRGVFQGSCTLECHGVTHAAFLYAP